MIVTWPKFSSFTRVLVLCGGYAMLMSLNTDEKSNPVCHSRIITVQISLEPNHGDRLMRLCLSWSLILCKFAQVLFGGFQLICRKNVSIFVGFASFTLCLAYGKRFATHVLTTSRVSAWKETFCWNSGKHMALADWLVCSFFAPLESLSFYKMYP